MLPAPRIQDLVVALLAVNQYPVDRAVALMPAFRERGLLDPEAIARMGQPQVIEAMKDAGYTRGGYLPIVSYRLFQLMEAVASGGLDTLPAFVASNDRDGFVAKLTELHGFGPNTAGTAWMLWTSG